MVSSTATAPLPLTGIPATPSSFDAAVTAALQRQQMMQQEQALAAAAAAQHVSLLSLQQQVTYIVTQTKQLHGKFPQQNW